MLDSFIKSRHWANYTLKQAGYRKRSNPLVFRSIQMTQGTLLVMPGLVPRLSG